MKKIVVLLNVFVFSCVFASCYSVPSPQWVGVTYHGEGTPLLANTEWVTNSGGPLIPPASGSYQVSFFPGGIFHHSYGYNGTWQRVGNTVTMVEDDGYSKWEGIYYQDSNKILGKYYLSDGRSWDIIIEPYVPRQSSNGSNYSGSPSTSSQQQTQKTYIVNVTSETSFGTNWTTTYHIKASSAQEAQILAEGQWRSTNFSSNKFLYSAVTGSY
jgi:hypothetical protein